MATGYRRPRKPRLFVTLMIASAVLVCVPPAWLAWTGVVLQPIAWMQWLASQATHAIRAAVRGSGDALPPAEQLAGQVEALRRQVLHQQQLLSELEQQVDALTGLRGQLRESSSHIVLATVIAADPSPLRDALVISKGTFSNVRVGDWVVAGLPRKQTLESGSANALLRRWLIGQVVETRPFTSVVRLCSDRAFGPVRVHVARALPDATWQVSDVDQVLYGRGEGRMEIVNATENLLDKGFTHVLYRLGGTPPVWLTLGRVETAEPIPEAPLVFTVGVAGCGAVTDLDSVYVLLLNR